MPISMLTLEFSTSSLALVKPTSGLSWSSANTNSTLRPPIVLPMESTYRFKPSWASLAMLAWMPVSGMMKPTLTGPPAAAAPLGLAEALAAGLALGLAAALPAGLALGLVAADGLAAALAAAEEGD